MSWDAYTDQLVSQGLKCAAICGLDGAMWAKSEGGGPQQLNPTQQEHEVGGVEKCSYSLLPGEAACIANGFERPDMMAAQGAKIGGVKYYCLKCDDSEMKLKKGTSGATVCKNTQCCVIGIYDESITAGQANTFVCKISDYLRSVGY